MKRRYIARVLRRIALLATLATLLIAAAAQALPGDPPSEPIAPADGASVLVNPDGIPVSFTCPVYRTYDDGQGFKLFGGPSDHGVSFSASSAVGADGRLADPVSTSPGQRDTANDGQCVSGLGAGGSSPRPQETPGTYYWQVWRLCTGCAAGYETGPVRRIVLRADARLALKKPGKLYAGYPAIVALTLAGLPDRTPAEVQRKAGTQWKRAGSATALGDAGEAVVTLAKGGQTLRVRARLGSEEITSPAVNVTVRPARGWTTSRRDDGAYKGKSVKFKVAKRGREIRRFRAIVPMTCPGLQPGQFTTEVSTAAIERVKVAPDGRFVGAASRQGSTMRVRGKLGGRRVRGGRVELSLGNCVGNAAYSAKR